MASYGFGPLAEALPELGAGHHETHHEVHHEAESELFFGQLASLARSAAGSPALRRLGAVAGRAALDGLSSLLSEAEGHHEALGEYEYEAELNPIRRVYPDALMEHLGHAAAEAESEAESEAFIGALIPLAAQLAPRVAPVIMRAAPGMIRGATGVLRTLRRNPTTRPLIRAIPSIVRGATATLARQVALGRPVTSQTAVRALASQAARVLGDPRQGVIAYRRSKALDRRYHTTVARAPAAVIPSLVPAARMGCACGRRVTLPRTCSCCGR